MARPLRLVFNPTGDLLEASRECEADIFLQWYGNTRAQMDAEYGPYEHSSVFVALADDREDVVGTVRFLVPAGAGLKTLDDMALDPWSADPMRSAAAAGIDPSRTWDCATMGLRSDMTDSQIKLSLALYHGLVLALRVNQVRTVIAILDRRVHRMMSSIGLILHPIPGTGTAPYLGSGASTPVYGHMAVGLDNQRRINPDAHRLVTLGIGLDGVSVPEHEAFLWTPREPAIALVGSESAGSPPGRGLPGRGLASAPVGNLG